MPRFSEEFIKKMSNAIREAGFSSESGRKAVSRFIDEIDKLSRKSNTSEREIRKFVQGMKMMDDASEGVAKGTQKASLSAQNFNKVISDTGKESQKASKQISGLQKSIGALSIAYGILASSMQAPELILENMGRVFGKTRKTVLEFENAVFLSGKALHQTSSAYKTANDAIAGYEKAVREISASTKLSIQDVNKLYGSFLQAYKGIRDEKALNTIKRMTIATAELGLTAEETGRYLQTISEVGGQYAQLREGIGGKGSRGAAIFGFLEGTISREQTMNLAQMETLRETRAFGGGGLGGAETRAGAERVQGIEATRQNVQLEVRLAKSRTFVYDQTLKLDEAMLNLGMRFKDGIAKFDALGTAMIAPLALLGSLQGAKMAGKFLMGKGGRNLAGGVMARGAGAVAPAIAGGAGAAAGRFGLGAGLRMAAGFGLRAVPVLGAGLLAYQGYKAFKGFRERKRQVAMASMPATTAATGAIGGGTSAAQGIIPAGDNLDAAQQSNLGTLGRTVSAIEEIRAQTNLQLQATERIASNWGSVAEFSGSITKDAVLQQRALRQQSTALRNSTLQAKQMSQLLNRAASEAEARGDTEDAIVMKIQAQRFEFEAMAKEAQAFQQEVKAVTAVIERGISLRETEINQTKSIRDLREELRLGIGTSIQDQMMVSRQLQGQAANYEQMSQALRKQASFMAEGAEKTLVMQQATEAQTKSIQLQTEAAREIRAIREGYLDAIQEVVFGGGGFAEITPTQGFGQQMFAATPALGRQFATQAQAQAAAAQAPIKRTAFGYAGDLGQFGEERYTSFIEDGRFKDMMKEGLFPQAIQTDQEHMGQIMEAGLNVQGSIHQELQKQTMLFQNIYGTGAIRRAGGGSVPGGYGGGDRVPILAESGEYVVPKHEAGFAKSMLNMKRAGMIRGYQGGGFVAGVSPESITSDSGGFESLVSRNTLPDIARIRRMTGKTGYNPRRGRQIRRAKKQLKDIGYSENNISPIKSNIFDPIKQSLVGDLISKSMLGFSFLGSGKERTPIGQKDLGLMNAFMVDPLGMIDQSMSSTSQWLRKHSAPYVDSAWNIPFSFWSDKINFHNGGITPGGLINTLPGELVVPQRAAENLVKTFDKTGGSGTTGFNGHLTIKMDVGGETFSKVVTIDQLRTNQASIDFQPNML